MATDNTAQFNADLTRFARDMDIGLDKVIRKIALDIFSMTVRMTPVDSGALRASWMIGVNVVSQDVVTVSGGKMGKGGASAVTNSQKAKLNAVKAGDTINITNNQPYAVVVEYGMFKGSGPKITSDGYSTQAPKGMMRRAVQRGEQTLIDSYSEWTRVRG